MASTTVVNRYASKFDVFIGRPSKWGNPYRIGKDGTRQQVLEKYRQYILSRPDLLAALPEIRGKVLGCTCVPFPCHGHILAELADGEEQECEELQF